MVLGGSIGSLVNSISLAGPPKGTNEVVCLSKSSMMPSKTLIRLTHNVSTWSEGVVSLSEVGTGGSRVVQWRFWLVLNGSRWFNRCSSGSRGSSRLFEEIWGLF